MAVSLLMHWQIAPAKAKMLFWRSYSIKINFDLIINNA